MASRKPPKNFGHAFMRAPDTIYARMHRHGLLADWVEDDIATLLSPLFNAGWIWDCSKERLVMPNTVTAMNFDTPWCHAKGTPFKHCGLDHMIIFNTYNVIPPRCQHCWKVVVAPNNFKQLMQLEQLEFKMDVPSKCGIELRDFTPRHYGGYFYNNSFEEGREKYEAVRKEVDRQLDDGKDVSVILKRACTEFELVKGPSPFWANTKEEENLCDVINAYVEVPFAQKPQSELVKRNVRCKWLYWAYANGDHTYKPFNGGQELYTPPVKYHEGDIDAIKADIAVGRNATLNNVPPKITTDFIKLAHEYSKETGISLDKLRPSLGDKTEGSPLYHVPKEAIGEHDELT